MKLVLVPLWVLGGLALFAEAQACGDTVFLRDGTEVKGEVRVEGERVTIVTEDGTLELRKSAVAEMEFAGGETTGPGALAGRDRGPQAGRKGEVARTLGADIAKALRRTMDVKFDGVAVSRAVEHVADTVGIKIEMGEDVRQDKSPVTLELFDARVATVLERLLKPRGLGVFVRADGGLAVGKAARRDGPAEATFLETKVDIDFDGVPVEAALSTIRQLTDANMALAPEVSDVTAPVTLQLKDVPVRTVLELVLAPRGLAYTIKPGAVLFVHAEGAGDTYVMRLYDVSDLLYSVADPGGAAGGGGSAVPQFGAGRSGAFVQFIRQTCGRGTWAYVQTPGPGPTP